MAQLHQLENKKHFSSSPIDLYCLNPRSVNVMFHIDYMHGTSSASLGSFNEKIELSHNTGEGQGNTTIDHLSGCGLWANSLFTRWPTLHLSNLEIKMLCGMCLRSPGRWHRLAFPCQLMQSLCHRRQPDQSGMMCPQWSCAGCLRSNPCPAWILYISCISPAVSHPWLSLCSAPRLKHTLLLQWTEIPFLCEEWIWGENSHDLYHTSYPCTSPFSPSILCANSLLPSPTRSCCRTVVLFVEHNYRLEFPQKAIPPRLSHCSDHPGISNTCSLQMALIPLSVNGPVPVCLQGQFSKMLLLCDVVLMH